MICPKCGFLNPADAGDCCRCGVIFAKIGARAAAVQPAEPAASEAALPAPPLVRTLFFPVPETANPLLVWGCALVLLVLAIWGGRLVFSSIASNAAGTSLLHLVNLPFHEAGHVLFRPLGRFMTSLGGTLGQLSIPLICAAVLLLKTRDAFGAALCCWWFGENLLDIAPYINDARAGVMPLLGGNTGNASPYGFHDWEYLLTETGLLRYDHALAKAAHLSGALIMLLALLWAGYVLFLRLRRCA